MFEFLRQMETTLVTGEWTHFQFYVIYAWLAMLPRALGAGVFYSFRPAEPTRLTTRYVLALSAALAVFGASVFQWAQSHWSVWYAVMAGVFAVFLVAPPIRRKVVRFLFSWLFYASHVKVVDQSGPAGARKMIALMTIFDEEPRFLEASLRGIRECLEFAGGDYMLVAIIDGYGIHEHAEAVIPVCKNHCDIVMTSNAQKKRSNLRALGYEIRKRGLIDDGDEIIHLIDSDIRPANAQVAAELNRPFADPRIGGVTTAQYVDDPQTFWQHVMQIFETIRNFGSQPFMSLFGKVVCLPGRWYAVLAKHFTKEMLDDLDTHSFSWFGLARHYSKAGDDRHITEAILKAGGRTIIALDAMIFTITPARFNDMRKMVTRWARSSNGYTFRALWMWKPENWPAAFIYWGNILLAFGTCYIVYLYWPYKIFFGEATVAFWEAMFLAFISMAMTMTVRFVPVWSGQLYYLLYMPLMGFVGVFMQTVQVQGIITHVHKIGTWGTRGADAGDRKVIQPVFNVIYVRSDA